MVEMREGELYWTRDGRRAGPAQRWPDALRGGARYPWLCRIGAGPAATFDEQGCYHGPEQESPMDLVRSDRTFARDKMICDVTLEDLRRGVARVLGRSTP